MLTRGTVGEGLGGPVQPGVWPLRSGRLLRALPETRTRLGVGHRTIAPVSGRPAKHLEFSPLANGLDYMKSVVDHLAEVPSPRDVKYAILHLAAGIEVLVKARLAQEHWTLVVEDIDKTTKAEYDRGEFVSVSVKPAMKRLAETVGITFSDADHSIVSTLIQKRNRLQHFGLEDTANAVISVAARGLDFLLSFTQDNLLPNDVDGTIAEALEDIRSDLNKIEVFVLQRLKRLRPRLDEIDVIVECPYCSQWAFEPGALSRCHFCGTEVEGEIAAADYVSSVLAISWRDIADGEEGDVQFCPDCSHHSLVGGVEVLRDREPAKALSPCDVMPVIHWVCFNEGVGFSFVEMHQCNRCGAPTTVGTDDGLPVCSDCYSYYAKDF